MNKTLAPASLLLSLVVIFVSIGIYTADREAPHAANPDILGVALPSGTALFETSLQDRITANDTTMTLVSASTTSGEDVSGYNCFIVDEGRSDAEFICGTVSGKTVSSLERGISRVTGTSTVALSKFAHRKGASVKITDYPLIQRIRHQLSGTDTIAALLSYVSGTQCNAANASTTICDKAYIDATANQGAATSSESNAGIARLATALQAASSTDLGSDTPLVLQAKNATDTPTRGCALGYSGVVGAGCNVVALLTGKISQLYLDIFTTANTWSQLQTFTLGFLSNASSTVSANFSVGPAGVLSVATTTATSTFAGHVSIGGNATTTNLTISGTCVGCLEGYERIETGGTMSTNNGQTTTIDANCTSGKKVVGGGYIVPTGATFLNPTDGYHHVNGYALDDDTWRNQWYCSTGGSCDSGSASTTAICVSP